MPKNKWTSTLELFYETRAFKKLAKMTTMRTLQSLNDGQLDSKIKNAKNKPTTLLAYKSSSMPKNGSKKQLIFQK